MSRILLTDALRDDYQRAFATCVIREEWAAEVEALTEKLMAQRARYRVVGERLNLPWFVVAVLHYADVGCDFEVHPHNGDPLSDRTHHLPDGRPLEGEPPFSWEDSATDALSLYRLDQWQDWSIAGTLFALEGRDGWGYRLHHPEVPSPYLWNYSTHYHQGKYVGGDVWNEEATAQRCGAAVLLRRLVECGWIAFTATHESVAWPLLCYDETTVSPWVETLQRFLNTVPGVFVKVDGRAGPRTSEAFLGLSGTFLPGDPRSGDPS